MTEKEKTKLSKFLSLVLRHKPEEIGIRLDENGWVDTSVLIRQLQSHGHHISMNNLIEIVETNEKQRFSFDKYKTKIRANQGHSLKVDLALESVKPPEILYHGTPERFQNSILNSGLIKGQRHHVHLSADIKTAETVGSRRGKPVIFRVHAEEMFDQGFEFFKSENGVWLTDHVPSEYISYL